MEKTRIFLIEDHHIVREGVLSLLEKEADIEIVGHAQNASEGIDRIKSGLEVDLILSDMDMPGKNGIDLIRTLKQTHPHIKIIILTMLEDRKVLLETISVGGDGFLLKSDDIDEFLFAIKHVSNGGKHICAKMAYKLLHDQAKNEFIFTPQVKIDFSEREAEVLACIAEGLTNHEMAEKLFASRRTIEGHRQKLLEKTGTSNTATLIRFAVQHRLIS